MILRKPAADDIAAAFAIFADPETNRFNPAGPMKTRAEAEAMVKQWIEHWESHRFGPWAAALEEAPEQVIGFGGLAFKRYGQEEELNLWFRFATQAWGKGLATELAEAAVALGRDQLGSRDIYGSVRVNHLASRRVLEKIGMRPIDLVPDPRGFPASVIYGFVPLGVAATKALKDGA